MLVCVCVWVGVWVCQKHYVSILAFKVVTELFSLSSYGRDKLDSMTQDVTVEKTCVIMILSFLPVTSLAVMIVESK